MSTCTICTNKVNVTFELTVAAPVVPHSLGLSLSPKRTSPCALTVIPPASINALSVPAVSNLILSSSLDSSTCICVSPSASAIAVTVVVVVNLRTSIKSPLAGSVVNVSVVPEIPYTVVGLLYHTV